MTLLMRHVGILFLSTTLCGCLNQNPLGESKNYKSDSSTERSQVPAERRTRNGGDENNGVALSQNTPLPSKDSPFCAGNGSEEHPFLICTANQLLNIDSKKDYGVAGANGFDNTFYKLANDIDVSSLNGTQIHGYPWSIILRFRGHLDGSGHRIYGYGQRSGAAPTPFFDSNGGVIENLKFENFAISGNDSTSAFLYRNGFQTKTYLQGQIVENLELDGTLRNIAIKNGTVQVNAQEGYGVAAISGGIIYNGNTSTITKASIENVKIEVVKNDHKKSLVVGILLSSNESGGILKDVSAKNSSVHLNGEAMTEIRPWVNIKEAEHIVMHVGYNYVGEILGKQSTARSLALGRRAQTQVQDLSSQNVKLYFPNSESIHSEGLVGFGGAIFFKSGGILENPLCSHPLIQSCRNSDETVNQTSPTKKIPSPPSESPFCGGNGSEFNPFSICTAEQLLHLDSNKLNSFSNSKEAKKTFYKLANDIDISGLQGKRYSLKDYTPSVIWNFQGHLDGGGHRLYGYGQGGQKASGSFIERNTGSIKNLVFEDFNLIAHSSTSAFLGVNGHVWTEYVKDANHPTGGSYKEFYSKGLVENVTIRNGLLKTNYFLRLRETNVSAGIELNMTQSQLINVSVENVTLDVDKGEHYANLRVGLVLGTNSANGELVDLNATNSVVHLYGEAIEGTPMFPNIETPEKHLKFIGETYLGEIYGLQHTDGKDRRQILQPQGLFTENVKMYFPGTGGVQSENYVGFGGLIKENSGNSVLYFPNCSHNLIQSCRTPDN